MVGEPKKKVTGSGLITVFVWLVLFLIALGNDSGWAVVLCAITFPLVCFYARSRSGERSERMH
jgi:cell division protein FtsW (lipid II flippase)